MRAVRFFLWLLCVFWWTVPSFATPVVIQYVNGSVLATATLDVENGQAVSGTGTIQGGGLIGVLPMELLGPDHAPAPLHAIPANDCLAGAIGCYDVGTFSCGCDFVGNDTTFDITAAIPVDINGIAFQVGNSALNYGFALYDVGDGTVGEILVGDAAPQPNILNGGTGGGTLSFQVMPEPPSLLLFMTASVLLLAKRSRAARHAT
jgi:hypothetical protein